MNVGSPDMPALKRRSIGNSRKYTVMERPRNTVDGGSEFDHEGNNISLDKSGSHSRKAGVLLDTDEISVITVYTADDNGSITTFDHDLKCDRTTGRENDLEKETENDCHTSTQVDNLPSKDDFSSADDVDERLGILDSSLKVQSLEADDAQKNCFEDESAMKSEVVDGEPIHMTLEDVQMSLYDWDLPVTEMNGNHQVPNKISDLNSYKHSSDNVASCGTNTLCQNKLPRHHQQQQQQRSPLNSTERSPNSKSLKHTLCHWLGLGKCASAVVDSSSSSSTSTYTSSTSSTDNPNKVSVAKSSLDANYVYESKEFEASIVHRALPPLPSEKANLEMEGDQSTCNGDANSSPESHLTSETMTDRIIPDFAASICKVKDCGWYWGPISGEMAEKILSSEPDGSFVVRDSSDERYIFSLTFKLNGFVRHVRIEHDHGNFSFGSFTKFKSHTIVEFIENAVRHSRSGRYLFFLHRRPVLGPMRVQLLYPVSRFKRVESLQHMCRFVILKAVRRDLIVELPLPVKLKSYLDTQQYYTEHMQDMSLTVPDQPESTEIVSDRV